tara:strand:- start:410 stop:631 length:222 start_codon:yes stop_codon:yes gene_type:complete
MSLRPQKRSLNLRGHQTSVTLEDRFWNAFCDIAKNKNIPINKLAAEIDAKRNFDSGLASTIRDYVLRYYMDKD